MSDISEQNIYTVPCPTCNARVGEQCVFDPRDAFPGTNHYKRHIEAARKLPAPTEPAPKEGEQEDEHPYPCGVMRLDSARARCLLESDHEGDCVWDDEPAPKEEMKPKKCFVCEEILEYPADDDPEYIGKTSVRSKCGHAIRQRQVEPAKVEAGDGVKLPPLDVTDEERERADRLTEEEWLAAYAACSPIELVAIRYCRERQLKASLLREQELKELLGEAANAIARHWDITDQAAKDVALKARAAVDGQIKTSLEREERLLSAINWAQGCGDGEFRERKQGEGAYWWRKELADRAGIIYDGEKFVIKAAVTGE